MTPRIVLLILLCLPCLASATETAGEVEHRLDKLLDAVQVNDYENFVEDGTAAFKAGLTKQMLGGVSAQLASRLKKGYSAKYLGNLSQQGHEVHLWKITYKDGGDDTLAKLVLKGKKTAGFWLQ